MPTVVNSAGPEGRKNDFWGIKSKFAWGISARPDSWWNRSCIWGFKPHYFPSVWHFYQAVIARSFLTPGPVRVWSDGVQALQVIFPPSKVFFRNSRGCLVVKGCSSIFLSFLFSFRANIQTLLKPKQMPHPMSAFQSPEYL